MANALAHSTKDLNNSVSERANVSIGTLCIELDMNLWKVASPQHHIARRDDLLQC